MSIFEIRVLIHKPHLNQYGSGIFVDYMNPAPVVGNIQMRVAHQSYISAGAKIGVLVNVGFYVGKCGFYALPCIKIHQIQRMVQFSV